MNCFSIKIIKIIKIKDAFSCKHPELKNVIYTEFIKGITHNIFVIMMYRTVISIVTAQQGSNLLEAREVLYGFCSGNLLFLPQSRDIHLEHRRIGYPKFT